MSYDRADWHYGGDFPKDLPAENGGTHIGMFLAWAITNHLEGSLHVEESYESIREVRERRMTGRQFLIQECNEKFSEHDLNDVGNEFAKQYYASNLYLNDYNRALGSGFDSLYHVDDSWSNFDRLSPVIDSKFRKWKRAQTRSWWQFWK